MPVIFDHEKLNVYQRLLDFVDFSGGLLELLLKSLAAHSQLDRISASGALNISEGNEMMIQITIL